MVLERDVCDETVGEARFCWSGGRERLSEGEGGVEADWAECAEREDTSEDEREADSPPGLRSAARSPWGHSLPAA